MAEGLSPESGCLGTLEKKRRTKHTFRCLCFPAVLPFTSSQSQGAGGAVPPVPPFFQVAQPSPSSCHISYWIGCLIKIIIKIDLLISMHLLCLSHPRAPLSAEDVRTDRRAPDPRPARLMGLAGDNIWTERTLVKPPSQQNNKQLAPGGLPGERPGCGAAFRPPAKSQIEWSHSISLPLPRGHEHTWPPLR